MPDTDIALDLRISQRQPQFDLCLRTFAVTQAAFLSACNPYSAALSASCNQARTHTLKHELQGQGWHWLEALGLPDTDAWQPEPSVLILGMDLTTARHWGRKYEQNALLHVRCGQPPQLIWLVD